MRTKSRKQIKAELFLNQLRKGSHTVEAAIIMGVSFFVIAAVLYMGSFLYGRACLTASAYEQAFTGRVQDVYGLWGFEEIRRSYDFAEDENKVSYQGTCFSAWGGFQKELNIEAVVTRETPVTFIRKWQVAHKVITSDK